jgi:PAS domain S-box-containing protein
MINGILLDFTENSHKQLEKELVNICHDISTYHINDNKTETLVSGKGFVFIFVIENNNLKNLKNLKKSIEIATTHNSPLLIIISNPDDLFFEIIANKENVWYLKEPYSKTELKHMLEHLSSLFEKNKENSPLITKNINDAIFVMDIGGNFSYFSSSIEKITGFTPEEAIERKLSEWITKESYDRSIGMIKHFAIELSKGVINAPLAFEIEVICKNSEIIWAELTVNPVIDEDHNFKHFIGVIRDINSRKRAEERFRIAVRCVSDLIYEWDMKTDHLEWFGNIDEHLGYEPGEIKNTLDSWSAHVHPEDLPGVMEKINKYRVDGESFDAEYRMITRDGQVKYWIEHGLPVYDRDTGKVLRTIGIRSDITEQKKIENALKKSEEMFRLIEDNANDVIWMMNTNRELMYISPSVQKLRGYTPEELLNHPLEKIVMNKSITQVIEYLNGIIEDFEKGIIPDTIRKLEVEQPCKDGSTIWTEMQINPIIDEKGNFRYFLGIDRDISERRKNEQHLIKQKNMLDSIFDLAPLPMLLLDENGITEKINKECTKVPGVDKETAIGKKPGDIFSCAYSFKGGGCGTNEECNSCTFRNVEQETFRTHRNFSKVENITTTRLPDGSDVHQNIEVSTAYIDIYDDAKVIMCFEDVTERKKTEEAIIRSKLEAEEANRTKSEFLATMSHELRTPLNAIIGYSQMLGENSFGGLNPKQEKFTRHIHTSGKHLLELINDILDLSKVEAGKMDLHLETFEVKKVLKNVSTIITPLAGKKNIEVDFLIDQDIKVYADKVRYKQILYNLLSNAVKFTPSNGHVSVKITNNGNFLTTSVIDNGIGISPEDQKKLFNPFYQVDSSTARKYQGTGLGLSIVKKMVELHGGTIEVESEPVKGSTFTYTIPVIKKK